MSRRPLLAVISLGFLVLFASSLCLADLGNNRNPPPPWPGWIKMPLLSAAQQNAGFTQGGEGAQWPRWDIAVSPADPNFLLLPTDVGGLYASQDGGQSWQIAMQGWNARGANGFAIDPKNASHIVGIGGNSMDWDNKWGQSPNGLYLSTDKAQSWHQTLAFEYGISGFVAFDPRSYDAQKQMCLTVYYVGRPYHDTIPEHDPKPYEYRPAVARSDDGGHTWELASTSAAHPIERDWTAGGISPVFLRVSPIDSSVWIGGREGLFRSPDKGEHLVPIDSEPVYGLDITPDGQVFVSGASKVRVWDKGEWKKLACTGLDSGDFPVSNVRVSPADPQRLLCWVAGANWDWRRYVSSDGGASWTKVTLDSSLAILPTNARQGYFTWSPTDPNIAWSIGGDYVTKSTDGGHTFSWTNSGYNGVMLGASFNFCRQDPQTVLLGFQDYNGAITTDGGTLWNYRDLSGKGWGGQCYGASQTTGGVMWYGDAEGWGGKRRTRISFDGGASWSFAKDADGKECQWEGADVSLTSPTDEKVLFASNWRSVDKGVTWAKMEGCEGVFIASADGKTLYGRNGSALVKSVDNGASWQKFADIEGGFSDVAVNGDGTTFYFASQERLKRWKGGQLADVALPHDQYGHDPRIVTVAVDSGLDALVYAGGPRNIYASAATVVRSCDGGATWDNLTRGDGPHEVGWIRVQPGSGDVWLNGQCYGMWRLHRIGFAGLASTPRDAAAQVEVPHF